MKYITYAPMGAGSCNSRYGFNGELKDKASGGYLLGNGTRLYLPGLGGFTSSDSLSPFSGGGLNPYRYCNADPINLSDPSGHMSQSTAGIIGVVGGIVGLLFAIPTGGASLSVAAAAGIAIETAGITVSSVQIANATEESSESGGISTGTAIGIGLGVLAVLGPGAGVGMMGSKVKMKKKVRQGEVNSASGSSLLTQSSPPSDILSTPKVSQLAPRMQASTSRSRYASTSPALNPPPTFIPSNIPLTLGASLSHSVKTVNRSFMTLESLNITQQIANIEEILNFMNQILSSTDLITGTERHRKVLAVRQQKLDNLHDLERIKRDALTRI